MKKTLYIISMFCLLLIGNSCIVDSEVSFLTEAEELGFTGTRDDIEEFLSTEVLSVMTTLGLDINTGSEPVDVTGIFVASPYCRAAATDPNVELSCGFRDFVITFSNQNDENQTISYQSAQFDENGVQTFSENGNGFISGDSSGNFTIIVRAVSGDGGENATAFSGRMTAEGIVSYQDIFVPNITSGEALEGALFIDEDGTASRQ